MRRATHAETRAGLAGELIALLHHGAPAEELARRLAEVEAWPDDTPDKAALLDSARMAIGVHERLEQLQQRERGLLAIVETAQDLSSRLELTSLLRAIVSRARNLLGSDLAWLSVDDAAHGEYRVLVADGATTPLQGAPVRCPGGADTGDTCLSDVQIAALKSLNTATRCNFELASGETEYPGFNMWGADLGRASTSPVHGIVDFLAWGTVAPADPMPVTGAPYIGQFLDQFVKYAVTRDPAFPSLTLDPENPGPWANRLSQLSTQLDTSTDISGFVARGGKLLLAHGLSDALVSSRATEIYYQRLQAQFGPATVDTFARYYEVPGFGHAVSSVFNATWDSLTALEAWVEQGVAPANQVTTDSVGVPGRTRPLCDYPKWPRYNGSGDPNLASSFTCVSTF